MRDLYYIFKFITTILFYKHFNIFKNIFLYLGLTDCTLPWTNPGIIDRITNICPTPLIGELNKEYCCYNLRGQLLCCEYKEFVIFGFVYKQNALPQLTLKFKTLTIFNFCRFIWFSILLFILSCICYFCGPFCNGRER